MSKMTRDRAIEILRDDASGASLWELAEAVDMAIEALKRQHGEWLPQDEFEAYFKCSICGIVIDNDFPIWREFCPHCGADMRKEGGKTE